jgi:hypothetical protein
MPRFRITATVAALVAVAVAGCGVGEGETEEGSASLRVTRDHGSELIVEATTADPSESETVARFLDREADVETSYGGNFITAINGTEGTVAGGRTLDWYFYVNGIWSPVGAAEARVRADDRIWWDYRDWTSAYRVPAVVGSYPEPFRNGFDGEAWPTQVVCLPSSRGAESDDACEAAAAKLSEAGVEAEVVDGLAASDPDENLRVLVGTWDELRDDKTARTMEEGPQVSGVFARPVPCGDPNYALEPFDAEGAKTTGSYDAAWVATLQRDPERPTWVVSGSTPARLADAVEMLDEDTLRDNYSVAAFDGGEPVGLPAADAGEGTGEGIFCR